MLIAIIEDNTKYRDCLVATLSSFADCKVIHTLSNALRIDEAFNADLPEIVLVDINLPGINGIEVVKHVTKHFPTVLCIMLTVNIDLELVLKSMQNGAKGYLIKDKDSIQKIVDSMRMLYNGNFNEEFPLNGTISKKLLNYFDHIEKTIDAKLSEYHLTARQKEILHLLHEGHTYKSIAATCNISIQTLNSHVKTIYPKLNIKSRSEINRVM